MNYFKVIIPAAGKGTRLGLPYPKTLVELNSESILKRLIIKLSKYDEKPSIIVNESSYAKINEHLLENNLNGELLLQKKQNGMGDAVLTYEKSKNFFKTENIILVWGDIPYLQIETIKKTIDRHLKKNNDFTFPTIFTKNPYTRVIRSKKGEILEVIETREKKVIEFDFGERDIGLFIFKKQPIFEILSSDLSGKYNLLTKEHGFLYIIKHLIRSNLKVEGIPIAKEIDTISINTQKDLILAKRL